MYWLCWTGQKKYGKWCKENGCTSILGFFYVKSWKVLVCHEGHLIVFYYIDTDEIPEVNRVLMKGE